MTECACRIYNKCCGKRFLHFLFLLFSCLLLIILLIITAEKAVKNSPRSNSSSSGRFSAYGKQKKLILFFTPVRFENDPAPDWPYSSLISLPSADCYKDRCIVAYNNQSLTKKADALIFNAQYIYEDVVRSRPSVFPGVVHVYFMQEPFSYLGRYPLENFKLPKNYFHWTMTHLSKSDIYFPYGEIFIPPEEAADEGLKPLELPFDGETIFREKEIKGALWIVSNCDAFNHREVAVNALSKYMRIDIGGKCGDENMCRISNWADRVKSCPDSLKKKYYFYIAIESANCNEYITEKYWSHYNLPIVLIVLRRKYYQKLVPPLSIIAMDDFSGPKEMADYLNLLMEDREAYLKHFQWRSEGWALAPLNTEGFRIGMCDLCDKLWKVNKEKMPKTIPDPVLWFEKAQECDDKEDFVNKWSAGNYTTDLMNDLTSLKDYP